MNQNTLRSDISVYSNKVSSKLTSENSSVVSHTNHDVKNYFSTSSTPTGEKYHNYSSSSEYSQENEWNHLQYNEEVRIIIGPNKNRPGIIMKEFATGLQLFIPDKEISDVSFDETLLE